MKLGIARLRHRRVDDFQIRMLGQPAHDDLPEAIAVGELRRRRRPSHR
jgi:hypothetical protein